VIAIDDDGLRRLVFMHVVELAESGTFTGLLSEGLPANSLDKIRRLSGGDLIRLAKLAKSSVQLVIDPDALERNLNTVLKMVDDEKMFEYFVVNGASIPMLKTLFKADTKSIEYARTTIGDQRVTGRPVMPSSTIRDLIHEKWSLMGTEALPRTKYYALHQMLPQFPLRVFYAVVNEFTK
jgi:Protein of unknown function (DUF2857)